MGERAALLSEIQYFGLSASIFAAKELGILPSRFSCEFYFLPAAVGPAGKAVDYRSLHRKIKFPQNGCRVRRYRESFKDEKRRAILKGEFTVKNVIHQFYSNYSSPFFYISNKHVGFHSKGGIRSPKFCYLRGLDRGRYWSACNCIRSEWMLSFMLWGMAWRERAG